MILNELDQFHIRDEFENFICPECGLKFLNATEVDHHLRIHTGEDVQKDGEKENLPGVVLKEEAKNALDPFNIEPITNENIYSKPKSGSVYDYIIKSDIPNDQLSANYPEIRLEGIQNLKVEAVTDSDTLCPQQNVFISMSKGATESLYLKPLAREAGHGLVTNEDSIIQFEIDDRKGDDQDVIQSEDAGVTHDECEGDAMPILERFSPLTQKNRVSPKMPRLEPIQPLMYKSNLETIHGDKTSARIEKVKKMIMSKYKKTRNFVCQVQNCTKKFFNDSTLRKHTEKFHKQDRVPEIISSVQPLVTIKKPYPKSISNTEKHVRFSDKDVVHLIEPIFNLPHGLKNGKYICLKCKSEFEDKIELREHLIKYKSKLRCNKTKKSRTAKKKLEKYPPQNVIQTETFNLPQDQPGKKVEDKEEKTMTLDQGVINNKSHSCPTCFKVFSYKKNLINHQKNHKAKGPFQCPTCFKQFNRKSEFGKHKKTNHKGNQFCCPYCPSVCTRKGNLTTHIRKKHTGTV